MIEPFPVEMDGAVMPGGCLDCLAEQRLERVGPGVWNVHIFHDPPCPALARIEAAEGGSQQ